MLIYPNRVIADIDSIKPKSAARKMTTSNAIQVQLNAAIRKLGMEPEVHTTSTVRSYYAQISIHNTIYSAKCHCKSKRSCHSVKITNSCYNYGTVLDFVEQQGTVFAILRLFEKLRWPSHTATCSESLDDLVGDHLFPVKIRDDQLVVPAADIIQK